MNISIVIPVYNDWDGLTNCIKSILLIKHPIYEIIIVDDGSSIPVPLSLKEYLINNHCALIHLPHGGVSVARNNGFKRARGDAVLFIDSDCSLHCLSLSHIVRSIEFYKDDKTFQLRIKSFPSTSVGLAEDIFQTAIQEARVLKDGHIIWLNTAGFVIRKDSSNQWIDIFDPKALRSQDTLFLVHLLAKRSPPLFISDAIVYHNPSLTIKKYIAKGFYSTCNSYYAKSQINKIKCEFKAEGINKLGIFFNIIKLSFKSSIRLQNAALAIFIILIRMITKKSGKYYSILCNRKIRLRLNKKN